MSVLFLLMNFFFLLFSTHIVYDEFQMNAIIPYQTRHPRLRSYRLRQHATTLQSPYVVQLSIKFSASSSVTKQVLAYALDDTCDER